MRCSAAAPAVCGVLQSSSSFGIGCRVGCRPSDVHYWRGTGERRRNNAGSILRRFLPADSASMSSERGEEMKCVRWRGDEELSLIHIYNIIINRKDCDIYKLSGIYRIKCNNCDYIYIGRTHRNFKQRFMEHFRAFNNKKTGISNIADHLISMNHSITNITNNMEINNNKNIIQLEKLYIYPVSYTHLDVYKRQLYIHITVP